MNPMSVQKTLLFFGIPGITIFLLFSFVYEKMVLAGLPICWSTYISLWSPLICMTIAVFVYYKKSRLKFSEYFWCSKLTVKQIAIVLAGLVCVQFGESLLSFTRPLLASLQGFHVPPFFPDLFRVDTEFKIPMTELLGMPLSNNPFPLIFFTIWWLPTNIICEEILWRGYALPRMEMVMGKWAWLVNGLLWALVIHFFFRWSFITLVPISLIIPYLSQKYKSLWPGVIIHGGGNILIYALLIPSYLAK